MKSEKMSAQIFSAKKFKFFAYNLKIYFRATWIVCKSWWFKDHSEWIGHQITWFDAEFRQICEWLWCWQWSNRTLHRSPANAFPAHQSWSTFSWTSSFGCDVIRFDANRSKCLPFHEKFESFELDQQHTPGNPAKHLWSTQTSRVARFVFKQTPNSYNKRDHRIGKVTKLERGRQSAESNLIQRFGVIEGSEKCWLFQ